MSEPVPAKSPLLKQAHRAACFFDWREERWQVVILSPGQVVRPQFHTEAAARGFIGLRGGSRDPSYRPPSGETNARVAIPSS